MTTEKPTMEHKHPHLAFAAKAPILPDWWKVSRMNAGSIRRRLMIEVLLDRRARNSPYQGVRVDDRHVMSSQDSDLQILLRRGILLRKRINSGGRKRTTELHLAPHVVSA